MCKYRYTAEQNKFDDCKEVVQLNKVNVSIEMDKKIYSNVT